MDVPAVSVVSHDSSRGRWEMASRGPVARLTTGECRRYLSPAGSRTYAVPPPRCSHTRSMSAVSCEVTPELLAEEREDPWGGDWRPSVGDCIRVILEEEWAHLRYIRRDLARLR